jgi:hypothetical protein
MYSYAYICACMSCDVWFEFLIPRGTRYVSWFPGILADILKDDSKSYEQVHHAKNGGEDTASRSPL